MDPQAESSAPRAQASQYPALSISKPPPARERVMTWVLSTLFGAALLLAIAAMVAHWWQAP